MATASLRTRIHALSASRLAVLAATTGAVLATVWLTAGACVWVVAQVYGPSDWAMERDMADRPFALSALGVAFALTVIGFAFGMGFDPSSAADRNGVRKAFFGTLRERLTLSRVCLVVVLYLVFSMSTWSFGTFHHWLHGGDQMFWLDRATAGHPFLTSALALTLAALLTLIDAQPASDAPDAVACGMPATERNPLDLARVAMSARFPDLASALSGLEGAHAAGDPVATHALAGWRRHGLCADVDVPGSIRLLREASDAGNAAATFELAVVHERGDGVPSDPAEAYQLYLRAALAGDGRARREVARCLEHGVGVAVDARAACAWRSVERGAPELPGPWLGRP